MNEVENELILISFMRRKDKTNKFVFPIEEDIYSEIRYYFSFKSTRRKKKPILFR